MLYLTNLFMYKNHFINATRLHACTCTVYYIRHFTAAAEHGHADACFALGEMFEKGHVSKVPPRNYARAESWYGYCPALLREGLKRNNKI